MIQQMDPDRVTLREWCATMERQVRQMVHLVNDLLDVSRISRDKLVFRRLLQELAPRA